MTVQKILVVEDNPLNMELAEDLLEAAGYLVLRAESAEEGIKMAKEEKPTLILMDVSLPGMDGFTATRILKQEAATQHIPLVILTAHAMKSDVEKGQQVSCDGFITKPIDTRSFPSTVAGFIENAVKGQTSWI